MESAHEKGAAVDNGVEVIPVRFRARRTKLSWAKVEKLALSG